MKQSILTSISEILKTLTVADGDTLTEAFKDVDTDAMLINMSDEEKELIQREHERLRIRTAELTTSELIMRGILHGPSDKRDRLLEDRSLRHNYRLSAREIATTLSLTPPTEELITQLYNNIYGPTPTMHKAPRLNIVCMNCSFGLGIRPARGPRGEPCPEVIWVANYRVQGKQPHPLMRWVTPDGQQKVAPATAATRAREEAREKAIATFKGGFESADHVFWRERLRTLNWECHRPDPGWVLLLERWQKHIRIRNTSENFDNYRMVDVMRGRTDEGIPTIIPFPVYYLPTEGIVRHKNVMLALGSQPIFSGTIGRCPRCGRDQELR